MKPGLQARLDRLFNRRGDGRAVCVAADHGYMSDVTANVVNLRTITEAVIRGGVDGILVSPGQAVHLAPLFQAIGQPHRPGRGGSRGVRPIGCRPARGTRHENPGRLLRN